MTYSWLYDLLISMVFYRVSCVFASNKILIDNTFWQIMDRGSCGRMLQTGRMDRRRGKPSARAMATDFLIFVAAMS